MDVSCMVIVVFREGFPGIRLLQCVSNVASFCSFYGILLLFVTSPLYQTLSPYLTCSKPGGFRRLTTETLLAAHEGSAHQTELFLSSRVY